mgnify:CR=1 FL=1
MDGDFVPVFPRYVRTPDAAVHLGLSARTLEKHRCYGTGPAFHKLGRRIVYAISMPGRKMVAAIQHPIPDKVFACLHARCAADAFGEPPATARPVLLDAR